MSDVDNEVELDDVDQQDDIDPIEAEARAQGWLPEKEFKGKPGTWRDAAEFVAIGERLNPILKKQRDEYKKELDTVKGDLEFLKATTKELADARVAALQEQHEATVTYLKSQIKAARRDGDHDLVDVLEEQLEGQEKKKPVAAAPAAVTAQDVEKTKWLKEQVDEFLNRPEMAWYSESPLEGQKDKKLTRAMNNIATEQRSKTNKQGIAYFEHCLAILKEENPEDFSKPRRPTAVESGGTSSARGTARSGTYEAMPKEARQMCDRFMKDGTVKSKDDYVKAYWSQKGV